MGSKVVDTLGTFEYNDDLYEVLMAQSQKALSAEVIYRVAGSWLGKSRTYYVKLRKEFLAAMLAEWDTPAFNQKVEELRTQHDRIKPEGMTRSLYPKQRRTRRPLSKGGVSRKQRRAYTKNTFRVARGMQRLRAAQAV